MIFGERRLNTRRRTGHRQTMKIVLVAKSMMLQAGSAPLLYLMIALSIVSLAIMLERAWFFGTMRENLDALLRDLGAYLSAGDIVGARARFSSSKSAEAAVVLAGLGQAARGPEAAAEAMSGAMTRQRLKLEHRLSFLGTLGNNAPFIGLLGTVVGIVMAFDRLGDAQGGQAAVPTEVMSSIAEALVATAVGLLVAIPAVAAFNHFQRRIKVITANADTLTKLLLAHLRGADAEMPAERS
jgi:biopolymer transport protein ExbB